MFFFGQKIHFILTIFQFYSPTEGRKENNDSRRYWYILALISCSWLVIRKLHVALIWWDPSSLHHTSISSGQQCSDSQTVAISWCQGERGAPALTRRHSDGSDDRPLPVTRDRTHKTSDRGRNKRTPDPWLRLRAFSRTYLQPNKTIGGSTLIILGENLRHRNTSFRCQR